MHKVPVDIELTADWKPKRNPVLLSICEGLLPDWLMPMAVFTSAIGIGIRWSFSFSPIVGIAGFPIAFLGLSCAWIFHMLTIGLFCGKFHFVNSFFSLMFMKEFRASQMFMIPFLILTKILYMALRHGNVPYWTRFIMLVASCGLIYWNTISFMQCYAEQHLLWRQAVILFAMEFGVFLFVIHHQFEREKPLNARRGREGRPRRAPRQQEEER